MPSFHCVMLHYMLAVQLFLQPQPQPHMYAVPSFQCVMLYYMLDAQLFLQPQTEPHIYRSAVVWLCYAVLYACSSTLSSALARTSRVLRCCRFIVLCCIICLQFNSFFSFNPNLICTAVPSSDRVMLYYMLVAQLFLQPQPVPQCEHILYWL